MGFYNKSGGLIGIGEYTPEENRGVFGLTESLLDTPNPPETYVQDGLVLYLDAGDTNSYGGSGSTWTDLSGGGKNHTIGSNASWVSSGTDSYFNVSASGVAFTGAASNSYGFSTEHTIEVFMMQGNASYGTVFIFFNNVSSGGGRGMLAHVNYGSSNWGTDYYDVNGCCGSSQRINGSYTDQTTTTIRQHVWRKRTSTTPHRQYFRNTTQILSSGGYSTASGTFNVSTANLIGSNWNGRMYLIRAYNKALTDAEILQNFNNDKARFGIT